MLRINRRNLIAFAGAIALTFTSSIGGAIAQDQQELRLGVNGLPNSLEPINAISNTGPRIVDQIFDRLLVRDWFGNGANGDGVELVPSLAESWERIDDKSVRFKLREGVVFHNGQELTAEDVAYTFSEERLWGDEAIKTVPNGRTFSPDWDEPIVEDTYTVVLRTKTPSYLIEKFVASWLGAIVPKDYYSELGAVEFGNNPIGTGPYKFAEFIAGDHVTLEANDDYWGAEPAAAQITYQAVPEPATRVAGLVSGEYDIITTLTPDDMALVNSYPDLETRGSLIENIHMFTFNMNQPIFQDNKLRRAMALAVDRPLLVEALWNDLASIPNGFNFPSYGESYDRDRREMEYDLEEAKRLVEESGYDGSPITYRTMGNYYANAVPAMLMMIEMWKEIGVNVVPEIYAPGTTADDADIYIRNWSNGQWLTDGITTMVTEFGPRRGIQERWGWDAPEEFNELSDQVMQMPDSEERNAAFNRLRDIFEEEAPAVLLYQPYDVYGVRKDLEWQPVSFETMVFRNNLGFE